MKRITFFIAMAIFCVTSITGQNSVDVQSKDEIISNLQKDIEKLKKEIEYYKETLKLLNSKITAQDQEVDFKINSVVGDSNTGKVVIEGVLINNGVLRHIQGYTANAFDPQGNEIRTFEVSAGAGRGIDELQKDVPVKFKVEFKNTIPNTPMLKVLTVKFYSRVGYKSADISVIFRDIPIEWK